MKLGKTSECKIALLVVAGIKCELLICVEDMGDTERAGSMCTLLLLK